MIGRVPSVRKRDGFGVAASLLLASLVWPLYGSAARLWWTFDDFFCIHFLQGKSPLGYLVSPELWRPHRMFTPFLLLSYQSDMLLFGLRPAAFYVHQLAALAVAAVALFWLLRLWLAPGPAFLASLLFLLGVPTGAWVQELLVRHYIEGLMFSMASVGLFVASLREERPKLGVLSAGLYLAAVLCKEIYVPLLGLLLVLPERDLRTRLRRSRAHLVVLAVYLAWRYAILGTLLGGYGWTTRPDEVPSLLRSLPGRVGASFVGASALATAALIAALSAGIGAALFRQRRATLLFLGALLLVLAPVLPVSRSFQARYGGLAWLAVAVAFGFGVRALLGRGPAFRALAGLLATTAIVAAYAGNRSRWRESLARAERMSAEEMFFLRMKDRELLRHPLVPPAAMNELRWFKEEHLGLPRGAGWFADDLYLCAPSREIGRIWEYRSATRSIVDVTSLLPGIRSGYCSGFRDVPLRADFSYEDGDFFWDLGPYETGRYAIVYGDGVERFDVEPRAGYRHHAAVLTLRVRYEAPEGWVAFSPGISLDLRGNGRARWERPP
jgi:hypothetical protein